MRFHVDFVDYDDTETESESEAPPFLAKRKRFEMKISEAERYFNNLEKRIRKLLFHRDDAYGALFFDDIQRKAGLCRFMSSCELTPSEMEGIITQSLIKYLFL